MIHILENICAIIRSFGQGALITIIVLLYVWMNQDGGNITFVF